MVNPIGERVLVVCGVVAVGLELTVMAAPSIANLVSGDEILLSLLGVVALVQTVLATSDFWSMTRNAAEIHDAHRVELATVQGEPFDRALKLSKRPGHGGHRNRNLVTQYLRETIVTTLIAETGYSSDVVRSRLDDGTWTDDPVAASLFTDDSTLTWGDRFRSVLGYETTFQRRVQRAVIALERRLEENSDE